MFFVFSAYFAGAFLKKILILIWEEIVKLAQIVLAMIKAFINKIINTIKSCLHIGVKKVKTQIYGPQPDTEPSVVIEEKEPSIDVE